MRLLRCYVKKHDFCNIDAAIVRAKIEISAWNIESQFKLRDNMSNVLSLIAPASTPSISDSKVDYFFNNFPKMIIESKQPLFTLIYQVTLDHLFLMTQSSSF